MRSVCFLFFAFLALAASAKPLEFQKIERCEWKANRWNDGDSFHVITGTARARAGIGRFIHPSYKPKNGIVTEKQKPLEPSIHAALRLMDCFFQGRCDGAHGCDLPVRLRSAMKEEQWGVEQTPILHLRSTCVSIGDLAGGKTGGKRGHSGLPGSFLNEPAP